jgi:integrase/recombinase XerD
LIAFVLLTGARDGAIASMKLKHVDLIEGKVEQDAREVKTKFPKTFATYFFPVRDDIRQIMTDWVNYLRSEKLRGLDDSLFPATRVALGSNRHFEAVGLDRKGWTTAAPICIIFKNASTAAGLPYFNPHSFRKTLAQFGARTCETPEAFRAWPQNLDHENVLTTFASCGQVATPRQAELIRQRGKPKEEAHDTRALEQRRRCWNSDCQLAASNLTRNETS